MGDTSKRYDEAFKREAVSMIREMGLSISRVSSDLGVSGHSLRTWLNQSESGGKLTDEGKQLAQLKRQLADVTMERDILKKAVAIFSRQPK